MRQNKTPIWQTISLYVFLGLLAYMPLHILISTWIGTSFGILEVTRVAKEGFLLAGAGIALALAIRRGVVRELLRDRLMWLITAFVLLNTLLALWRNTDQDAELLGLAYNVRFLIYFVWAVLLTKLYVSKDLLNTAVKIAVAIGAVTVIFGLFQYILLPDGALSHLGYTRSNGVLPAFFIDDKPDLERIMSTLRDPNSFGSYLLIFLGFLSVGALTRVDRHKKIYYICFSLLTLLAVFWTFSRAAWIGAVATLIVTAMFFAARKQKWIAVYKTPLLFVAGLLVVAGVVGLITFRNTYLVKNVVLHADESTVLEDPNELRIRYWQESFRDIADNPLGSGPGTAGLASIRNDERTVLNENYYFQTAQETGVLGLLLLLAILVIVALRLFVYAQARDPVAAALLAGLAGLMITNFLAHIWANEAAAYTWWGLAGLAIFAGNSHNKLKKTN
jgi:O-antigen ligase/polysaccharide polymerase Wzy-like membrane protein